MASRYTVGRLMAAGLLSAALALAGCGGTAEGMVPQGRKGRQGLRYSLVRRGPRVQ